MELSDLYYEWVVNEIVSKGRPRVTTRGGHAHAYTPRKTVDGEKKVRDAFLEKYGQPEMIMKPIALELFMEVQHGIPRGTPKKDIPFYKSNLIKPIRKSDLDNAIKAVADSLIGFLYEDDCQITHIVAHKSWADEPRVVIQIRGASDL